MFKVYALFILGLVLICVGGDRLVDAAVAISNKLGIPQIVVGATIVSIGTTLPEILVSTTAAFNGSAAISAGNAFGSIICNTALIAGLAQTIKPSQTVNATSVKWRAAFFLGALLIVEVSGLITGQFSRLVGIILLTAFAYYAYLNVKRASIESDEEEEEQEEIDVNSINVGKQFVILLVCAILLYFGANLLVDNGILIAEALGVPERVIAVTFIALGTSLPELVTSVVSLIKGYGSVGLGNIIGANLLNVLLVIGIPATILGIPAQTSTLYMDVPIAGAVMGLLIIPMLIKQKGSRLQGLMLLAIYIGYCIMSF